MSWNYRFVDWGYGAVDVREVYYDKSGKITHWTANPREITGETRKDIVADLRLILRDAKRFPTLAYTELPGTSALGIETEGQDRETGLGAEHESPTAEGGDAPCR